MSSCPVLSPGPFSFPYQIDLVVFLNPPSFYWASHCISWASLLQSSWLTITGTREWRKLWAPRFPLASTVEFWRKVERTSRRAIQVSLVVFLFGENWNWSCKFSKVEHFNEWTGIYGPTFRYMIGTEERVCHVHLLAFLSAYHFCASILQQNLTLWRLAKAQLYAFGNWGCEYILQAILATEFGSFEKGWNV